MPEETQDKLIQENKALEKQPRDVRQAVPTAAVQFDHNIDILPDTRLPEYDVGEVKAYRALGRDKTNYFALICERHLVPRIQVASNYIAFNNPILVPLTAVGIVWWPLANQQRFVFIYRDVLGKKLLKGTGQALDWRPDDVMNVIVKPMITALVDFKNRDFVHGNIWPGNMFSEGQGGKVEKITLGECLTMPASSAQPVLYQTIERGMVAPIARGEASFSDDLYALGVTLAVFMRSNDPLEGMSGDEILSAKVEMGSYAAITGKERFKGSILELLRGILHDDPTQRWTLEEIMMWMDGRRLSPKQSIKEKKAPRAVLFAGQKYYQSTLLAMNLGLHPPEVINLVESGELEQWLIRSVEDDLALGRVEAMVKISREKGTGPGYDERLAANLSVALDTKAPLRYKGLRMMGEGIGKALVEAMVQKRDIQPYVELFSQNIAFNWINTQENPAIDVGSLISRFDSCRNYIRHGKIGYGIERCVYVLCPEAHCLSEKLNDYFIRTPEEMIMAFEDMCRKNKAPALFLDRHSAAFLSVKESKVIDPYLFDLGSGEEYKKILCNLKCLGAIQKRSSMPAFPGIAHVFMENMDVLCARYHDREVREKLQKSVARCAAEGDLAMMAGILNNIDLLARDMGGFREATHEYATLKREYVDLELRLADQDNFGRGTGREIAAVVSSIIAAIIILCATLMFFNRPPAF